MLAAALFTLALPAAMPSDLCEGAYEASGLADADVTHMQLGDAFLAKFDISEGDSPVFTINGAGSFDTIQAEDGRTLVCIVDHQMSEAAFEYRLSDSEGDEISGTAGEFVGSERENWASAPSGVTRTVLEDQIDSEALGQIRRVSVYRPDADCGEAGCPVVFTGDNLASGARYTAAIDAAVRDGLIAPVIVASAMPSITHRGPEYMRRKDRAEDDEERHQAHLTFFFEEFIPWVEAEHPISADPADRVLFGFSNSADFAISALEHRPNEFNGAVATSPRLTFPVRIDHAQTPVLTIAYGAWEAALHAGIEANALESIGVDLTVDAVPGGHSQSIAVEALIDYLIETHPGPNAPER